MNPGLPTPPSFQGVIGRAVAIGVVACLAAMAHSWNSDVSVRVIEPTPPPIDDEGNDRPKPHPDPDPGPGPGPGPGPDRDDAEGTDSEGIGSEGTGADGTGSGGTVDDDTPDPKPEPVAERDSGLPWFYIDTAEALDLFEQGEAVFVDARLDWEFVEGHIDLAYFLPASEFNGPAGDLFFAEVDPAQLIVIYCGGGECDASQNTANRLAGAGYTNYRIYHDGYEAWVAAGGLTNAGPDIYGVIEK